MAEPLKLPDNFNPDTCMLMKQTEQGVWHETRQAAELAAKLLANGTSPDLDLAEKVLAAVLACQEKDPCDPHCGNFYWMREDDCVEDLNAVEFVLAHLIPALLRYQNRLSESMRQQALAAVALGLEEICRLDVVVAYTNIAVMDIHNSCLGGQLLARSDLKDRGKRKLMQWIRYTNQSGVPFEYNSPTYTAVTLRTLKQLAELTDEGQVKAACQAMSARIGLSTALHLHRGTGRWAGPHSRAYHPTVTGMTPPEVVQFCSWLETGTLPDWLATALDVPTPFQIVETADRAWEFGLTTYHSRSFALGTATRGFGPQANSMLLHYTNSREGCADAKTGGTVYTRYILNDAWFGSFYHETDRSSSRNLLDAGEFLSVQDGPRAICLYSPRKLERCSSAKTAVIFTHRSHIDAIWVGNTPTAVLPGRIPSGESITFALGDVFLAIRPLAQATRLGRDCPITLVERDGSLVLELYNYRGPAKRFWELQWPGAFYKGNPVSGFYLEVGERSEYRDAREFIELVARGSLHEKMQPPFTYTGEGQRLYSIEYRRPDAALGLQVDLIQWKLKRRWTHKQELGYPMLECPAARESPDGYVKVGQALVRSEAGPVWLYAAPEDRLWAAGYLGLEPANVKLHTPQGTAEVKMAGPGTMVWSDGKVTLDTGSCSEPPRVIRTQQV